MNKKSFKNKKVKAFDKYFEANLLANPVYQEIVNFIDRFSADYRKFPHFLYSPEKQIF